jgi:hypothetical protein
MGTHPRKYSSSAPTLLLAGLLALGSAGAVVAQPPPIDLATVAAEDGLIERVLGSENMGRFGVPVAGGLDVDGDGFADATFASMTADAQGRQRAGRVDLVFGDGEIRGTLDTAEEPAAPRILQFLGAEPFETTGSEIWIDDVTGDGLADLLICRQNAARVGARPAAGALTIVPGSPELRTLADNGGVVDLATANPPVALLSIYGSETGGRFCMWVRTGDVDGDGVADLLVGADQEDSHGDDDAGAAYLIRGGDDLVGAGHRRVDVAGPAANGNGLDVLRVLPPTGASNFHFGATVQVGDLDGDGRGEVLVSAALNRAGASLGTPASPEPAEASGGAPNGRLWILWSQNLPAPPWNGTVIDLDTPPDQTTVLSGSADNRIFGEEMLAGFDFDANGSADLFVSDFLASPDPGRVRAGIAYVFFDAFRLKGQQADADTDIFEVAVTRILGPTAGAIGGDTAVGGDFNGDGVDDLMSSSPHDAPQGRASAGSLHILLGRPGGWPAVIDTANRPTLGVRVIEVQGAHGTTGGDTGDTLAYSAAAGDMDGDGRIDLLINEMVGNGSGPENIDAGNLLILGGDLLGLASGWRQGRRAQR